MDKTLEYFLKMHRLYENKSVQVLIKEFHKVLKRIPYKELTLQNSEELILKSFKEEDFQKALFKVHWIAGQKFGERTYGKIIEGQKKEYPMFSTAFRNYLLAYYNTKGGLLITSIADTFVQSVMHEIKKSTELGETTTEMQERIYKTVQEPTFYKWQAMRIARTETSFAMNSAQYVAINTTGVDASKVWITKKDGRERDTHKGMNGVKVGMEEYFKVGDSKLLFPSDRENGSSKETIQCRCTYSYVLNT